MERRKIFGILLLILSIIIPGWLIFFRNDRLRLSAYSRSESEIEAFLGSALPTDDVFLTKITFNGYAIFLDETSSSFYYSLVENDPDAFDPFVRYEGVNKRVKLILREGELSPESIGQNHPLRLVASDGKHYREYQLYCTTLPLMNIESDILLFEGKGKDRDMVMTLFDNREGVRQRLLTMSGLIHLRGNSTMYYPKKGYKLTLNQISLGNHIREFDQPLLGMDSRTDGEWLLYSAYNDQERIRNVFSSNLWFTGNAGENRFKIKNGMEYRYLELFINGQYWGLYALGYPLDSKQMTPQADSYSVKNIYMFKKIYWEPEDTPFDENIPVRDFEVRGKDAAANETAARELLAAYDQWIRSGAPDSVSDELLLHAEMINAIDVWLFVNLIQGMDIVKPTGGFFNMFLTIVETDSGSTLLYTPWDLDMTWGNYWVEEEKNFTVSYLLSPEDNSYVMLRNPANFLLPDRAEAIKSRYAELRRTVWSEESLDRQIDAYERQVFDSGAYRRDLDRWPDSTCEDPALKLSVFTDYVHSRLHALDQFVERLGK